MRPKKAQGTYGDTNQHPQGSHNDAACYKQRVKRGADTFLTRKVFVQFPEQSEPDTNLQHADPTEGGMAAEQRPVPLKISRKERQLREKGKDAEAGEDDMVRCVKEEKLRRPLAKTEESGSGKDTYLVGGEAFNHRSGCCDDSGDETDDAAQPEGIEDVEPALAVLKEHCDTF